MVADRSESLAPAEPRIFSLKEAEELLPRVKEITGRYEQEASQMQEALERGQVPAGEEREMMLEIDRRVNSWARKIVALGIQAKGLWLVDFDSGDGFYYCWKLGESNIEYMHGYEETFADRREIWKMDREDGTVS